MATFAAKLHSLSYQSLPQRINWLDGSYVERVCEEVKLEQSLVEELHRQKATFRDFWDGSLPSGIVHGDLHVGNIIVDANDQITTIIDWEEAGVVPVILDIAGIVQSLAEGEDGFDRKLFDRFFAAYQSVRKLTQAEKDSFEEAVRYQSFIVYVWTLMKYARGLMAEEKMIFFRDRFYRAVDMPAVV